ncbi:MAG: hypothetical protein PUE84_09105 [Firmicutes bacterium]|nr:hypothetical protein [Bacillota bacterium]
MIYNIFNEKNTGSLYLSEDLQAEGPCASIFPSAGSGAEDAWMQSVFQEKGFAGNSFRVFLIGEDEEANLRQALRFLKNYSEAGDRDLSLYVFSSSEIARGALDSVECGAVKLTLVDPVETAVWNLMEDHPIYEAMDRLGDDELRVMIVGQGPAVPAIIKTVYWCGRMRLFRLKMNMIGGNMRHVDTELKFRCPGLFTQTMQENLDMKERGLITPELFLPLRLTRAHYFEADTSTEAFEIAMNQCLESNYIIIDEGSDEATIRTALAVRAHFGRKHVLHENFLTGGEVNVPKLPDIYVYLRGEELTELLPSLTVEGHRPDPGQDELRLVPFGSLKSVYTRRNTTDNPLDRLAEVLFPREFSEEEGALEANAEKYAGKCMPPTIRRMFRASALHLRYKLRDLNLVERGYRPEIYSTERFPEMRNAGKPRVRDIQQNFKFEMTALEHQTWVVLRLTDGWIPADAYHSLGYGRLFEDGHREHRFFAAKMSSACVESSALSGTGTKMYGNPSYFTEYNRETAVKTCSALQAVWPEMEFSELVPMDLDL